MTNLVGNTSTPQQPITQQIFGKTPGGQSVEVYTLTNANGVEARIMTFGAILLSLRVPDRNGKLDDVVLGFDTLEPYFVNNPHFGSIVGRFANRIANGRFTLDGTEYQLPLNDAPNTLHGGNIGFDKLLWQAAPAAATTGTALSLSLMSEDGDEGFPGNLTATVVYTLTDANELSIEYEATTDKATPVNLTSHGYFNLAGQGNGDILNHDVYLNADRFTPVNGNLIPTGELRAVAGTPLDFTTSTALGERIGDSDEQLKLARGYDHNFVINSSDGAGMRLAARVEESTTGRAFEVHTNEPAIQLYSGNFLDGTLTGKSGRIYKYRYGLCLETQHYPDSPNQPAFPNTVLKPGETYSSRTVYTFSVL